MGCTQSQTKSQEFLHSKTVKTYIKSAIETANDWKISWIEFLNGIEKSQLAGTHWTQDEEDLGASNFFLPLKNTSIQTTELFILSRTFLDQLEEYIYALTELLSEQQIYHSKIKANSKIEKEIEKDMAKTLSRRRRVSPESEETEFDPQLEQVKILKKKNNEIISSIKQYEDSVYKCLFDVVFKNLLNMLYIYGKLWNSFSEIFYQIWITMGELKEEKAAIGSFSSTLNQKQRIQKEQRQKLLLKWIQCSKECQLSWENNLAAEMVHCNIIGLLIQCTKRSDVMSNNFIQKSNAWKKMIDKANSVKNTTLETNNNSTILSNANISNVLKERITILGQIYHREDSVKNYFKELDILQSKKPSNEGGGKKSNHKNLEIDAAKHKIHILMKENRVFRLEQIATFEKKQWMTFKEAASNIGSSYINLSGKGNENFLNSSQVALDSVLCNLENILESKELKVVTGTNQDSIGSRDSIIAPLISNPKPPAYSEEHSKSFMRASTVQAARRKSSEFGTVRYRRHSTSDSVPSITVFHSEDDVEIQTSSPINLDLLDPTNARMISPVKPPPPIPKGRRESRKSIL